MKQTALLSPNEIAQATAAYFGQPVQKMTAPGGKSRTSFRVYFADRTVIVSQRPHTEQVALEMRILKELGQVTDCVPRFLGNTGSLFFQSDAGTDRLNRVIHMTEPDQRPGIAAKAVEALLEIQRAARRIGLEAGLPAASIDPYQDDDLLRTVRRAADQLDCSIKGFDPARLSPLFRQPPARFVKWDCRAGNSAVDATGKLRWFDFEDARLGHGPEDLAWLIADEAWPVDMEDMFKIVQERLTAEDGADPAALMEYLEQFVTLHAIRRIRLIFSQARRRGWLDRVSILKYDWVGVNPHMGERLCVMAAAVSQRHPATMPLLAIFNRSADAFRMVRGKT